jgi:hypothetical protein
MNTNIVDKNKKDNKSSKEPSDNNLESAKDGEGSGKRSRAAEPSDLATPSQTIALVVFFIMVFMALTYMMLQFWPSAGATGSTKVTWFGNWTFDISTEARWILLVMVAGAMGSFIHAATSLGDFIGNRAFVQSWISWYLLRLPLGSAIALLVYFLLRGGYADLFKTATASTSSTYGIVGLSALAGMFAKKTASKLGDVVNTVFKTNEPMKDKIDLIHPTLQKIVPNPLTVDNGTLPTITLIGSHFQTDTEVEFDGELRTPDFASSSVLTLTLEEKDIASSRNVSVYVKTPNIRDGKSEKVTLVIVVNQA